MELFKMKNVSIGHHARVSNLSMTEEQDIYFTEAISDLKEALKKMGIDWFTINIEIKEIGIDEGNEPVIVNARGDNK